MQEPPNNKLAVEQLEDSSVKILSFAVELPHSILQGWDDPNPLKENPEIMDHGVVGTITLTKNAAWIWFGWGKTEKQASSDDAVLAKSYSITIGGVSNHTMGGLQVAMPRTNYQGAFSNRGEAATSRLIGSENEDTEIVARQMASRLSQKLGQSVFVSCSLQGNPGFASEGVEEEMIQHRAAAHAEKEIAEIITRIRSV